MGGGHKLGFTRVLPENLLPACVAPLATLRAVGRAGRTVEGVSFDDIVHMIDTASRPTRVGFVHALKTITHSFRKRASSYSSPPPPGFAPSPMRCLVSPLLIASVCHGALRCVEPCCFGVFPCAHVGRSGGGLCSCALVAVSFSPDSRGQLIKDIARVSKDITLAYKARSELQEDVQCMAAVLDALMHKRSELEVRPSHFRGEGSLRSLFQLHLPLEWVVAAGRTGWSLNHVPSESEATATKDFRTELCFGIFCQAKLC